MHIKYLINQFIRLTYGPCGPETPTGPALPGGPCRSPPSSSRMIAPPLSSPAGNAAGSFKLAT